MLLESFDRINADYLRKLCNDKCPESQTLDFKLDTPGKDGKGTHELMKDVCAFANTDGGDLVYGVQEVDSAASAISPINSANENAEKAKERISQVLSGVEPRIEGIRLHHVDIDGGYILVIRVPSSFDGPHSVRVNTNRRFAMRNGATTSDLSYDQLRQAFGRTASLTAQAQRFIQHHLDQIIEQKTSIPMGNEPLCIIQLVPIAGLAGRKVIDLNSFSQSSSRATLSGSFTTETFNLDGLLFSKISRQSDGCHHYCQIFRSGSIEQVSKIGSKRASSYGDSTIVYSIGALVVSNLIRNTVKNFLRPIEGWAPIGPALLSIALLNVKNYGFYTTSYESHSADRPNLIVPAGWIDNLETADVDAVIRPLMDTLWQAFGLPYCYSFDQETGAYTVDSR